MIKAFYIKTTNNNLISIFSFVSKYSLFNKEFLQVHYRKGRTHDHDGNLKGYQEFEVSVQGLVISFVFYCLLSFVFLMGDYAIQRGLDSRYPLLQGLEVAFCHWVIRALGAHLLWLSN